MHTTDRQTILVYQTEAVLDCREEVWQTFHGSTTLTLNVKVQRQTCIIDDDADRKSVERRYNPATTLINNVV